MPDQPIEEKWKIDLDEKIGNIVLFDRECGDMLYRELAYYKKIESFIENLLEQERKRTMDGLESVYKQARWSEEGYDALDEVKKAIINK